MILDLPRHWILHGEPDPYGIYARLAARKEARLSGKVLVASYERRGRA